MQEVYLDDVWSHQLLLQLNGAVLNIPGSSGWRNRAESIRGQDKVYEVHWQAVPFDLAQGFKDYIGPPASHKQKVSFEDAEIHVLFSQCSNISSI